MPGFLIVALELLDPLPALVASLLNPQRCQLLSFSTDAAISGTYQSQTSCLPCAKDLPELDTSPMAS